MFNPDSIAIQTRREFRGDVTALCAFYRFYYGRIWQKQPAPLLEKVARQMQMFLLPYCRAYDPRISRKLGGEYQYSVVSLSDPICRKVWMRLFASRGFHDADGRACPARVALSTACASSTNPMCFADVD